LRRRASLLNLCFFLVYFSFFLFPVLFFETGGSRQPDEHARDGGGVLFARYLHIYIYIYIGNIQHHARDGGGRLQQRAAEYFWLLYSCIIWICLLASRAAASITRIRIHIYISICLLYIYICVSASMLIHISLWNMWKHGSRHIYVSLCYIYIYIYVSACMLPYMCLLACFCEAVCFQHGSRHIYVSYM